MGQRRTDADPGFVPKAKGRVSNTSRSLLPLCCRSGQGHLRYERQTVRMGQVIQVGTCAGSGADVLDFG